MTAREWSEAAGWATGGGIALIWIVSEIRSAWRALRAAKREERAGHPDLDFLRMGRGRS